MFHFCLVEKLFLLLLKKQKSTPAHVKTDMQRGFPRPSGHIAFKSSFYNISPQQEDLWYTDCWLYSLPSKNIPLQTACTSALCLGTFNYWFSIACVINPKPIARPCQHAFSLSKHGNTTCPLPGSAAESLPGKGHAPQQVCPRPCPLPGQWHPDSTCLRSRVCYQPQHLSIPLNWNFQLHIHSTVIPFQ